MVGHQAVGVEIKREFSFLKLEHCCEPKIIVVRTKNLSAIIAASDDVIEASSDFDSWLSRHGSVDAIE